MNINEEKDTRPIMVSIRCTAYNHEKYIRDALEGFVMQKTNFRFEAIVHDDASTDATAAIIREYAEKYPDIIKPIYETENQYSKHDGSLRRIMTEACVGKYIALCEGDDYWTDPYKLQKQVDFMEKHPDYSMCWTDACVEVNGMKKAYNRYSQNCQSPATDIIEKGGDFIPTCSILVKNNIMNNPVLYTKNYYCGDYPLQMFCAFVGKVYYISIQTCVYRYASEGSWTEKAEKETEEQKMLHYNSEKLILDDFNKLSNFKYQKSFEIRSADILFRLLVSAKKYKEARPYLDLRKKYNIKTNRVVALFVRGYPLLANLLIFYIKMKANVKSIFFKNQFV